MISRFIDYSSLPPVAPEPRESGSRLSKLLSGDGIEGYSKAINKRKFRFPEDHGPHPGFRNEWWYLTGNLDSEWGQRFGFELTFFRFALRPEPNSDSTWPSGSNWQTHQVYIAHFAVTDKNNQQFHVAQRFSRDALGLAGAQAAPFKVWIDDWSIREKPNTGAAVASTEDWELTASDDNFSLQLNLIADKPPVLNGTDGLSQKSAAEGNASYYYSISRLRSEGTLRIAGETHRVSGLSWLDREWSSSALAPDQQGWDWFALQLSDGSDLMFYNIRKNDGSQDEHSAGTWIAKDGASRHLSPNDLTINVTGEWESPEGGVYPSRWDIRLPEFELEITVTPVIDNQELFTTVRYWEGAVDVTGQRNHRPIKGRGYVELTGYTK
ncbi:MAG: lipocalin-like domain-containing protein [Xanthomonadales bacterium]